MLRYFKPVVELPSSTQVAYVDKFGGLPWGLPPARWPRCASCKRPQTFLAQLRHHPTRLDLGGDDRVLFVFQCGHDAPGCETWSAKSGANACLLLEADELRDRLTRRPTKRTAVETEVWVSAWRARKDNRRTPAMVTKLGGAPSWIQGDGEGPRPPWRWVAQLDSTHVLADGTEYDAASYGDAGMAYVYVDTGPRRRKAVMFWQCA